MAVDEPYNPKLIDNGVGETDFEKKPRHYRRDKTAANAHRTRLKKAHNLGFPHFVKRCRVCGYCVCKCGLRGVEE